MKTIEVCPSTLRPGFSTYSPQAVKELFDGVVVSPFIDIDSRCIQLSLRYRFNVTPSKYKGTGAGNAEKNRL